MHKFVHDDFCSTNEPSTVSRQTIRNVGIEVIDKGMMPL
jgi:hypothetical protein